MDFLTRKTAEYQARLEAQQIETAKRKEETRRMIRKHAPDLADFINALREKFGAVSVGNVKFFTDSG